MRERRKAQPVCPGGERTMKPIVTKFPLLAAVFTWGILVVTSTADIVPTAPADEEARKQLDRWERQALAESPAARREAAQELARFPERALPTLIKLLQDQDAGVRLAAVKAVRAVVSGMAPLTEYGPAGPGLVLVPVSVQSRPAWTGEFYLKLVGRHARELKTRLKKLTKDRPAIRAAAEQTLHRLDVRLAAVRVRLRSGGGKPMKDHPDAKVEVVAGELRDPEGNKRLAELSRGNQFASCWTFSPDGRLLAVGIDDDGSRGNDPGSKDDYTIRGYLRVYDAATGERLGDAGGTFGPVTHVAFSKDAKTLFYQTGAYQEVGGK